MHQSGDATKVEAKEWDRESIKAELRRLGYSLARLDRMHDFKPGYFSAVLVQPLPRGEKIIADMLGETPSSIWPDRYGPDGRPLRGRFLPRNDVPQTRDARQVSGAE
ncbi:helix-turn-helix domain-containing protein [Algimonas porphyrae]|uniref:Ner winged helix-turn-helix DNA-binding domain-containing protein n=1 Tax=Algimonas porphyrae TaxID=1128113 RepID=A0ABQ5V0Y9_9PROT|nr:helix-turn-helix domain-containing protein [Algimonas porphyrae]GLQ20468.1 hypothetical protein GCM10007854_14230 [Algimonas porphyrae]